MKNMIKKIYSRYITEQELQKELYSKSKLSTLENLEDIKTTKSALQKTVLHKSWLALKVILVYLFDSCIEQLCHHFYSIYHLAHQMDFYQLSQHMT